MTSDARRRCIIDAAKGLFAERGFLGVTTRQLAAAVGVTEPVIYEHFSSKRGLYDEVLLEESKLQVAEFVRALEPFERARDDEGFFRKAGEFLLARVSREPCKLKFLLQVLLEGGDSARLFYENQVLPTHEYLCRYIEARIAEGAFRPVNSRVATRQFISFVVYHNSLQLLVDDRFFGEVDDNDVVQEVVSNFLNGIQQAG
ncbi:MAG: TetR/AcrR family transcriptional regulator [Bryobacterales bacterium]|nr:TetR/AcrR family transcriptional regulator [Bryobacterales bacterium]